MAGIGIWISRAGNEFAVAVDAIESGSIMSNGKWDWYVRVRQLAGRRAYLENKVSGPMSHADTMARNLMDRIDGGEDVDSNENWEKFQARAFEQPTIKAGTRCECDGWKDSRATGHRHHYDPETKRTTPNCQRPAVCMVERNEQPSTDMDTLGEMHCELVPMCEDCAKWHIGCAALVAPMVRDELGRGCKHIWTGGGPKKYCAKCGEASK